jgi:hypothetical protein
MQNAKCKMRILPRKGRCILACASFCISHFAFFILHCFNERAPPRRAALLVFRLALLALLLPLAGCGWLRAFQPVQGPVAPVVLTETPSLSQVLDNVNQNTARVRTYATRGARISSPGYPALRANLAVERPKRFRLWAET